jgi:hypothetical protein
MLLLWAILCSNCAWVWRLCKKKAACFAQRWRRWQSVETVPFRPAFILPDGSASRTIRRLSFLDVGATKCLAVPVSERTSKPVQIYQIKVTLRKSQPLIWRRIRLRSDVTLAKLHRILQCAMGWEDAHLHRFVIRGERYGIPDEDDIGPSETRDERKYKLCDVMPGEGAQFIYLYDFGDNWEHILVVESALPPQEGFRYPSCLAGDRTCPPEDVGGLPGYESFLEAISDPAHPEHKDFAEWIGGPFDPDTFDVDEVNERLRAIR